jgi:NhaA family Na+:H+ antiporter
VSGSERGPAPREGGARSGARRARDAFAEFFHQETSGALVLLAATCVALVIANTYAYFPFEKLLHTLAGFHVGDLRFDQSIKHWIDDALMAVFFFVVGLEIKREFIVGELSTLRGALLPILAAVGGMVVPAAIYLSLNAGGPGESGWGVPMATDIAFALGILALLGSRIPTSLKVFLSALAIADDIGAIIVIALFYSEDVSLAWLLASLIPFVAMVAMNRFGVQEPIAYLAVASVLWFCVLNSGIHATIAGVIAAFAIPATARLSPRSFIDRCSLELSEIERLDVPGAHTLEDDSQQRAALRITSAARLSVAPLQLLEFALHPFSAFIVLPLFALANASIRLVGSNIDGLGVVGAGIVLGLVVGKPRCAYYAERLAVRTGLADLPAGVTWKHVMGAGALGGIGFTMSLFVANLAFNDPAIATQAKIAILVASVVAGCIGYAWLRALPFGPAAAATEGVS